MQEKQMVLLRKEDQIRRLLTTSLRREGFEAIDAIDLEDEPMHGETIVLLSVSTIMMDGEVFKKQKPQIEYYTSPATLIRLFNQLGEDTPLK